MCGFWELVGIPCKHAVAALQWVKKSPETYIHKCYTRETYERCYQYTISPLNGPDMWSKLDNEELLPPKYKRLPGRPKKLRRREPEEVRPRTRLSKRGVVMVCQKCKQPGHNK